MSMRLELPKAARDALAFEEVILPGGLTVRLLPMPSYGMAHVIYSTGFGSIHRAFKQGDTEMLLPAGVAHFLEHKMFENADGVDAFTLYGQTGAAANAYTSFDRTSYIFTATSKMDENLDILLSFVSNPHFTEATIAKEQGIIAQEIKMYDDHAELRCIFALLECLYHNHPIRDDIVGTVESIGIITPEILYACTKAFYNPSGMALCAAGNLTMDQLLAAVERAGVATVPPDPTTRIFPAEPDTVPTPERSFTMPVSMPIFALGFKELPAEGDTTRLEVVCDLLTELLCGETSALYRRLYDEGLIQPGFGGEFNLHEGCLNFMFTGESDEPGRVREELLGEIERQRREGIDEEHFNTCKRMMYGEAIANLESVERVASLLSGSHFRKRTPLDELSALASVTLEDVEAALHNMLRDDKQAFVVVRPE